LNHWTVSDSPPEPPTAAARRAREEVRSGEVGPRRIPRDARNAGMARAPGEGRGASSPVLHSPSMTVAARRACLSGVDRQRHRNLPLARLMSWTLVVARCPSQAGPTPARTSTASRAVIVPEAASGFSGVAHARSFYPAQRGLGRSGCAPADPRMWIHRPAIRVRRRCRSDGSVTWRPTPSSEVSAALFAAVT
jgi:hypothetical protein